MPPSKANASSSSPKAKLQKSTDAKASKKQASTKKQKVLPSKREALSAISSPDRLEALLQEAENELALLQPQIEKIEKQIEKLRELKLNKQKLITFRLSVQSILSNFNKDLASYAPEAITIETDDYYDGRLRVQDNAHHFYTDKPMAPSVRAQVRRRGITPENATFIPEHAFQQASLILTRRNSINYELFRAIVFCGGVATTDDIRAFLLQHDIRQPGTGETFEDMGLSDISSRVNYLVRKGIVKPDGRGVFVSCLGWLTEADDDMTI